MVIDTNRFFSGIILVTALLFFFIFKLDYILLALSILHDITSPLHNIREYTDFEKQLIISSLKFLDDKLVTE